MSKKKELLKNFIIIFIGKISTQMISFFLLPLYTTYLTTNDYGIVDLIITYISLLVPIITLQLEMSVFRFLIDIRNNELEKKKLFSTVFNILIKLILLFIIISLVVVQFIKIKYYYLIIINIIICIFSNMLLQIARGLGKNITYSVGSFISGVTTIILNVILIAVIKIGAEGMLISMIFANLLNGIYIFINLKLYKYIKFKIYDKVLAHKLIKYSLPLIPNGISWWIMNVSDRTIISLVLGVSANGIYAISNKFSSLYLGLFNIFSLSWTESSSKHINDVDKDEYFSDIINTLIKVFSCLYLFIIAVMPFIFNIIINKQFSDSYNYIPILMLGALISTVVGLYSGIYIAKKLTKQVMNTSIVSAVINIIINLIFIKFIGLYAAAISTFLAYFIMMIYRNYDLKKYLKISYKKRDIFLIVIVIIISLITYYINQYYLNIIILLSIIIFIFIMNLKEIKYLIRNLTKFKKLL